MTLSIVGHCADTGQVGVAISSSSIAVGARCPWVRAGVGAVSTQNVTLPALGPRTLDLMQRGSPHPSDALEQARATDAHGDYRQVIVVDARGRTAMFTGAKALGVHTAVSGEHCVAAGNLLSHAGVIDAMVAAFEAAPGALADRLMTSLRAAIDAGGEAGPVHSAALLIAGEVEWPVVDLRVDWADDDPIGALSSLWQAYRPQMQDYLNRALDPAAAPSYGVPGDA
ncbi:MAG: DUF1028 domain-containing protein [Lautropia sp.]